MAPRCPVAVPLRDQGEPFVTSDFHGTSEKYAGAYSAEQLAERADWLVREGKPTFVYFNNAIGGEAPRNATALRELVSAAGCTTTYSGPGTSAVSFR
jgi:uncharacterized protein YecE (DUF72 family)